jgi:hypothetical protein
VRRLGIILEEGVDSLDDVDAAVGPGRCRVVINGDHFAVHGVNQGNVDVTQGVFLARDLRRASFHSSSVIVPSIVGGFPAGKAIVLAPPSAMRDPGRSSVTGASPAPRSPAVKKRYFRSIRGHHE